MIISLGIPEHSPEEVTFIQVFLSQDLLFNRQRLPYVRPSDPHTGLYILGQNLGQSHKGLSPRGIQKAYGRVQGFGLHGPIKTRFISRLFSCFPKKLLVVEISPTPVEFSLARKVFGLHLISLFDTV